jgi:hypothetical protein
MRNRFVTVASIFALSTPGVANAQNSPEHEPNFAAVAATHQLDVNDQPRNKDLDLEAVGEAVVIGVLGGVAISYAGMRWVKRGLRD